MSESDQWQCPNCGGYKTSATTTKYITQKTPVPTNNRIWMGVIGLVLILIPVITQSSDTICLLLVGALMLLSALFESTNKKQVGDSYRFTCSLCGYTWDWSRGQPVPKAKVNSDLIAKGAQKLEQEEEQRRKQQEDAAALYHLTHRK